MTTETVVCFDLDGTLVSFDDPYDVVFSEALARHVDVPGVGPGDGSVETAADALAETYDEAFFDAFGALEPEPYRAGMAAVLAETNADGIDPADSTNSFDPTDSADPTDPVDPDDLAATLREVEYAATSVSDAVRDCLRELAADPTTTLAVVTDGVGDWQRGKLAHHDLVDHFDEVVVSYDVGGHKTDGTPYDAVRDRLDADEYVMVGDDYEADVEAARAAGFVPIHYEDGDGPDLFATLRAML